MLTKAIKFADEFHSGQKRRDGISYITHPLQTAIYVSSYCANSKDIAILQAAAVLHDVIEDTAASYFDVEREFGPQVASIVQELTNDEEEIKRIGKLEYHKKKLIHMSKYAFTIKLCDRMANIVDSPTDKYKRDTQSLLIFLQHNRDLSETQARIIEDILALVK
jgi:(p)ppGpp synthase/HD superfamily hydrolase